MTTQQIEFSELGKQQVADWAKDSTLKSLLGSSEKSNDFLNFIGKKLASGDNALLDELRVIAGAQKDTQRSQVVLGDDIKNSSEQTARKLDYRMKYLGQSIQNSITGLTSVTDSKGLFGHLASSAKSVGSQLDEMGIVGGKFLLGMGAFVAVVDFAWHRVTALSESFTSLYSTGLVFDTGMRGIIDAANGAGMTVENFSKMITKFGAAAASVGVKNLSSMNQQFLKNTRSGAELQMTQDQASEAFLNTVETMRSTGKLSTMDRNDIIKSGQSLVKNYNQLAEATGRNREEIANSTRAIMKQSDVNVLARLLPPEQRLKLTNQIASYAANFGEGGKELASLSAQIQLAGGSMGTLQGDMASVINQVPGLYEALNSTDEEAPKRAAEAFGKMDPAAVANLMNSFPEAGKWINQMVQEGQQSLEIDELRRKQKLGELNAKEKEKLENADYLATQAKVQKSLAELQNSITKVAVSFGRVLMPVISTFSAVLGGINYIIGVFADGIDAISNIISRIMKTFMGEGTADTVGGIGGLLTAGVVAIVVKKVLGSLMGGAAGTFTKLLSWGPLGRLTTKLLSWGPLGRLTTKKLPDLPGGAGAAQKNLGSAGAGITGGLKTMVGNISSMIGEVFKTLTGILKDGADAIGSAISSLGKGIGSALGNLGSGLGKAVEGIVGGLGKGVGMALGAILEGLASGLTAFANPLILLGAGIFGASITLIGAGIAGATWIMGKALPTFAEGLKSFSDIDGDNLEKVGLGTLALGAGLAVMGAGEVVNAIGGLVSGVLGWFQEDPKKKIERFVGYFQILADKKDVIVAGSTAFKLLGQINADGVTNMINAFSTLGNGQALGNSSMLQMLDDLMPLFERLAKNNTIINQAVNSLNSFGRISPASIGALQSLLYPGAAMVGITDNPGASSGISPSNIPSANGSTLDKLTTDYYEKTTMQFNRMIELLEIAHADAIDLQRIETDGLKDITDAVKSASGRIF